MFSEEEKGPGPWRSQVYNTLRQIHFLTRIYNQTSSTLSRTRSLLQFPNSVPNQFQMQSIAVFSLCVVAVASYTTYQQAPPAYGGYGTHHGYQSKPNVGVSSATFLNVPAPQIVRLHHEMRENVANNVQYETTNGIRSADNTQILPGTPNPENPREMWNKIAKSGFYAYTSPEGKPVEIHWTADGINGFRATGDAIPTAPPA